MGRPYGLLRAGFPYVKTLGMRRVTNYPVDLALDRDDVLYVLCRSAGAAQIVKLTQDDVLLGNISGFGTDDGRLQLPAGIIIDRDQNIYVSDEGLNRISIFDTDGKFISKWGVAGDGEGQLNRPAGLAFDPAENIYVIDAMNNRVQKFSKDGTFLLAFGRQGTANGEFNLPWGIAVDDQGDVYVADWRNDRIQKFTADGKFIFSVGRSGNKDGEFDHPAGVAVDRNGDIFVADSDNNRVQLFNSEGRYVDKFIGDAALSRSGLDYMLANAKPNRLRDMANLEPQKRLRRPKSVLIDDKGRLFIPDYQSYRIQVYQNQAVPLTEEQLSPPLRSPTLLTT